MACSSSGRSRGLERCSFTPASPLRWMSSEKALAVMAMMGTVLASGRSMARMRRVASRPSISGIITSIRITSK